MGQSTDAYLFYGYCWDEYAENLDGSYDEDDDYEDDEDDEDDEPRRTLVTDMDTWAEKVLGERGHVNPWDSHDDSPDWTARNRQALDEWYALKSEVKEAAGVEWDSHCSSSYPMPFLCIPESKTVAYRGDRKPITELAVGDGWDEKLAAHMQAQGANPPDGENQPGWWLVSYGEL